MRMADLPGTIYSPLSENVKTKAMRVTGCSNLAKEIEAMDIGETIAVPHGSLGKNMNRKYGAGTFSSKKVGDRHYITRNK